MVWRGVTVEGIQGLGRCAISAQAEDQQTLVGWEQVEGMEGMVMAIMMVTMIRTKVRMRARAGLLVVRGGEWVWIFAMLC
jgi:hypothetical protein